MLKPSKFYAAMTSWLVKFMLVFGATLFIASTLDSLELAYLTEIKLGTAIVLGVVFATLKKPNG